MKRISHLFEKIISDENLKLAIKEVCKSHRWIHYPNKPNKTTVWLESTINERVEELRQIIVDGFVPSPVTEKRRYDSNARKWREISEPRIWPDQCVHHALIQVLQPIFMRGMDKCVCGSIKGRGVHYGIKKIKKWMSYNKKISKYTIEADIYHFYPSLKPEVVMNRMKCLIKDYRTLDLIERIITNGIRIGFYCSQWFANVMLQPLDQLIRNSKVAHYVRYMDNFTIFVKRKRDGFKLIRIIQQWLNEYGLTLKGNWQVFDNWKRMPNALGYRFGHKYTLLRKNTLLKLKRELRRFYYRRSRGLFISAKFATGLISRLGNLKHCNSTNILKKYYRRHTLRWLKDIVRSYQYIHIERKNYGLV